MPLIKDNCKYCGLNFKKAMCVALLVDLGCHTNIDPINCARSPTGKHDFTEQGDE